MANEGGDNAPLCHGRYIALELSVFAFDRIAAGRRLVERSLIA